MESIQLSDIQSLSHIKFISQDNSIIHLEVGSQQFQILLPQEKDGFCMIELPITLNGYGWLSRVNEYIFE